MVEFVNGNFIFLAIPVIIIAALLWVWSEKRRTGTLKSIISDEMAPQLLSSACNIRRVWRNILFTAAWVILAFCLLRPYSGVDIEERKQQSRDILVVFDVSNSMNVIDCYGESRLDYGRNLVRKLVKSFPSDRYGLLSFSGLAFIEIPLTSDAVSYDIALEGLKKHKIPLGGTNIQIALDQALKEFKEGAAHKAMILISDGEEIGGDYRAAAEELKKKNVKLITVLTGDVRKAGTVRNVNDIPLRNRSGDVITSRADSKLLKELAAATGGVFVDFDPNGNTYQQLNKLKAEISEMSSLEGDEEEIRRPREIYQPFLLVAIVLLLIRMFFGERRKSFNSVAAVLALFLSLPSLDAQQQTAVPQKQLTPEQTARLEQLKNEEAELELKVKSGDLEGDLLALGWYNLANVVAERHAILPDVPEQKEGSQNEEEFGSFQLAELYYGFAIDNTEKQKGLKASAFHNMGSLYQNEARNTFLQEPDQAIELLKFALQQYKNAIVLRPGDSESRKNLILAYKDIKRAEIAKEIHALRDAARKKAGSALFSFKEIKDTPVRSPEKSSEIIKNTRFVVNNCEIIKQKLKEIRKPEAENLFDRVIAHSNDAAAKVNDLSKEAANETEMNLTEAYKLLGGNPDNPNQDQDQNNENDADNKKDGDGKNEENKKDNKSDKENKDQNQQNQDKKNDQQNKSDQSKNSGDQKDGEKEEDSQQDENGFFNKNENPQPQMSKEEKERRAKIQEAEALLRKVSDTEKEVREHIRERRAEMLRQEMRRKGISIPPEADK